MHLLNYVIIYRLAVLNAVGNQTIVPFLYDFVLIHNHTLFFNSKSICFMYYRLFKWLIIIQFVWGMSSLQFASKYYQVCRETLFTLEELYKLLSRFHTQVSNLVLCFMHNFDILTVNFIMQICKCRLYAYLFYFFFRLFLNILMH